MIFKRMGVIRDIMGMGGVVIMAMALMAMAMAGSILKKPERKTLRHTS